MTTRDTALRVLRNTAQAYLTAVNSDGANWAQEVASTRASLATAACIALPHLSALLAEAERPAQPLIQAVLSLVDEWANRYTCEEGVTVQELRDQLMGIVPAFSLSQEWVSRITASDQGELAVLGGARSPRPSADELKEAFELGFVTGKRAEAERPAVEPEDLTDEQERELAEQFGVTLPPSSALTRAKLETARFDTATLATLRQFAGWLTADIEELHSVEVPRLEESLNRFVSRTHVFVKKGTPE